MTDPSVNLASPSIITLASPFFTLTVARLIKLKSETNFKHSKT
jgi:hypothetical protein